MIYIDRKKVNRPQILSDPAADTERDEAREFFSDASNENKSFKGFKLYRHQEVKEALRRLFHGKCAYCESQYLAIQPEDSEHWRPKARVDLAPGKSIWPGFFEEATEWENLLPSCIDCNRQREQYDGQETRISGKGNLFPVKGDPDRIKTIDDLRKATPLLLNPCSPDPDDAPQKHLEFLEEGAVRPKRIEGEVSEKGRASIQVFGLNRSGLARARREHALVILHRLHAVEVLSRILAEQPDDTNVAGQNYHLLLEELLMQELLAIERARRDDQPYAQLTRQLVYRFCREHGIELEE